MIVADYKGGAETPNGAISPNGRIFGTYVHGIFDNDAWQHTFIDMIRASIGLSSATEHLNVTAQRNVCIDRLADHLRSSLDLGLIQSWVGQPEHAAPLVSV